MSIQYGGSEIRIDSNDLQLLHRNTLIAIKVRVIGETPYIIGCIRQPSGAWESAALLDDETFVNSGVTPETEIARVGSAKEWVRQVVLPRLQEWLNALFPAIGGGGGGPTALEQIAAEVAGIRLTVQSDGTVKATMT